MTVLNTADSIIFLDMYSRFSLFLNGRFSDYVEFQPLQTVAENTSKIETCIVT